MDNPIIAARTARGLSRREFAIILGRSYERITALELASASAIPKSWRSSFEEAGFSFDEISDAYDRFRAAETAAARQALLARK